MKMLTIALCATCLTAPAFGQSTAISGANSTAKSQSAAGAVAIGGGNATGGNARANANGNVGNVINLSSPANTTSTIRQEGKTSVETVPNAYAPGLAAAGIETCLGSVSGGGSWLGTGISLGGTVPDQDCAARLDARTLWAMGPVELKKAAIARLCQRENIYRAMPLVCDRYLAQMQPVAVQPYPAQNWSRTYLTAKVEPILLIDGNTGKERLCNNYDEPAQKCVTWAYATPQEYAPKKKKVSAKPAPVPLPKIITAGPEAAAEAPPPALGF